ncbi:hypothetical protein BDY24DRAFT_382395 [Mrakia frigida]|uniref:uncharacterized protein n=1 Tax=Mrakia frigida TaxID=29902 RepID=UPI003FCBFA4F
MASAPSSPSSGPAPSSDISTSKRLHVPTNDGGGEERKIKKARVDEPPPSFPDATFVPISSLASQPSPKESWRRQYIRGEVFQVSKWKEETQTAKIWLKDETAIVVELKGIWAKNVDLPKLNSKVAVSLEGIVLKEKEAGPGQGSVGVIFVAGVKMKWGKASVDGFQLQRTLSDVSSTTTLSGSSASLADIEAIMVARSSSEAPPPFNSTSPTTPTASDRPAYPPPQQPAAAPPTSITTLIPVKRSHPPSPEAGPSSKKLSTSVTSNDLLPSPSSSPSTTPRSRLLQAESKSSARFSSPPSGSSKMRNLVLAKVRVADPNLDGDLLVRVVDTIMHAPKDVLKKCLFDATLFAEQMEMARVVIEFEEDEEFSSKAKGVQPPVIRVDEPPLEKVELDEGGAGAGCLPEEGPKQPTSPQRVRSLPPSTDAPSSVLSPPIPPPATSTSSAIAGPSRLAPKPSPKPPSAPSAHLPSASATSTLSNCSLSISASSNSTSSTSSNGTKLNKAQRRAERKAERKKSAAGGGGGGAPGPGGSGSISNEAAGAKRSRMAIENGEFQLGLKIDKYTYLDIATLQGLPAGPAKRSTIGVVTNIQPLKISKSGQPFVAFRIDDPSGHISAKVFAKDAVDLPTEPRLQIGSVILLRDLKRQDFKETPDFVGGSYDGYSWAFVDTDIEKFVHQPLRNSTRDLESLATLGPLIESYFRKLAVWSKKKFELVKDEDEVVRFANESVAVKSKGRRTLRLEEIVDEREFFDCIGQIVKVELTDFANDVWIVDWTSNESFEDYGPPTSYDATPTEPFGQMCFKISLWKALGAEVTSSLRAGKVVRFRNVKPRVKNFWEGSMYDEEGCRIERALKTPELDALLDRRAVFISKLRADTMENPLPDLASMVKAVPRSNPAGRQSLSIEDLKPETYCNIVCQIISLRYLNSANTSILEVTDFSENRLISPSTQPPPRSNPPVTRFGRFVLQVTLWEDEGRGSIIRDLIAGDFVKIENVEVRLHEGRLQAHVNPRKAGSIIQTLTVLHEENDVLVGLLSRRHFFFNASKKDDLEAYRPPPPASLARPPPEDLAPPQTGYTRRIRDFVVGDVVDCVVQLVSLRSKDQDTKVLFITDFTSNPFITMAERTRASRDSVYPKEKFGRCVLTVWIDESLKLEPSFFDRLVEGKILCIRGMRIKSMSKVLTGVVKGGEGGAVEIVPDSDSRATSLLQLRYSYYNPSGAPLAPSRQASTSTISRVSPPQSRPKPIGIPSVSSDPIEPLRTVKSEPKEATSAQEEPVAGSSPLAKPDRLRFAREQGDTSTSSSDAMILLPRDAVSSTRTSFLDPDHPNGSSLLQISTSTRLEFQTRARIVDYHPKLLEEIVVSTCDICDRCLDPDETRCTCPRGSEEFVSQAYRLLLVLEDGTKETLAAFCNEQLLELFPDLPPASQFAESSTNPTKYLRSKLKVLAPHLIKNASNVPAPLLDLGLRRKVVRVDGCEKIFCSIFATTFRDAV